MRRCRRNTASKALSRLDSVGRRTASLLALALALAALGLSACGSDSADLLPGATADQITSNLDQVRELVGEGECVGAEEAAQEVSDQIGALGGVDRRLKQALREGANRLALVVEECEEAPEEETEPAVETAIEPEEDEEPEDEREKPSKEKAEPADKGTQEEGSTLPPQAEGKAKGHEKQEEAAPPPAEEVGGGTAAGGVGPEVEAGEGGP